MIVIISVGCYFLVSYFRRLNAAAFEEAVVKKKAADAKLASGAYGDVDNNGGANVAHHGSERDSLVTPLIH